MRTRNKTFTSTKNAPHVSQTTFSNRGPAFSRTRNATQRGGMEASSTYNHVNVGKAALGVGAAAGAGYGVHKVWQAHKEHAKAFDASRKQHVMGGTI